ncbi:HIT domain-containing protein [Prosthecomicrobium hirschii]|uniref:HIT domain-containing protein n=1 Tax=Prosthecodimorpha hirschii TaxID=665126 RepID=UPI002220B8BB|nr:HIT family protein [Prosthecomicrobium hirschii]MCW1841986.1 HIT family protein [Prosthecomicrobium hirschii]
MTGFTLDPRLDADTLPICDLPLSSVRLLTDANYPWVVLVPRQPDLVEIVDLSRHDQGWLWDEIARVSTALRTITGCDKLNVAALGNVVAQLHVHVIARFRTDPAWPAPVWGKVERRPYDPAARDRLIAELRAALA